MKRTVMLLEETSGKDGLLPWGTRSLEGSRHAAARSDFSRRRGLLRPAGALELTRPVAPRGRRPSCPTRG